MCDHLFGVHAHHQLQTPRTQLCCSTCGRVYSIPIDCCTHPDFYRSRHHIFLYDIVSRLRSACSCEWSLMRTRWRVRTALYLGRITVVAYDPDYSELADTTMDQPVDDHHIIQV